MGERCLVLWNEFKSSGLNEKHLLNTNDKATETIIEEIINDPKYKLFKIMGYKLEGNYRC